MNHRVAIIGCGRPGRGQARGHVEGYLAAGCDVVALADIVEENAVAFQQELGLTEARIFTDYQEMLRTVYPDVVSVCLWPHLHAQVVKDAARAGVHAIHCEKPMAPTWGEAREMTRLCSEVRVQLTFNHQRRFALPVMKARELLRAGTIGELQRIEAHCDNLFDWGTHWFDLMGYFTDDQPAEWVLAQMEWRGSTPIFGVPIEKMGLSQVGFSNNVQGLLVTGKDRELWGAAMRLIGTEGVLELGAPGPNGETEAIALRYRNETTTGWEVVEMAEGLHDGKCYVRSIADMLESLASGSEPQLSARRASTGTELIFASYESCRRRGKVELPLQVTDSGLISILKENNALPSDSLVN